MRILRLTTIVCACLGLLWVGCAKSTSIGGDILEQDQVALQFVDTFTVRTATVQSANQLVYDPTTATAGVPTNFSVGHFADPVFGTTKADLYFQVRVNENALPSFSENDVLDSIILKLEYDLEGLYGNIETPQRFEVYRISEPVNTDTVYYSDKTFSVIANPIGTTEPPSFIIDTTSVFSYSVGDTVGLVNDNNEPSEFLPHLRINLTEAFGEELFGLAATDNESFLDTIRGFAIKAVGGPTDAMLSFRLSQSSVSELSVYYKDTTRTFIDANMNALPILKVYNYEITGASVKLNNFQTETGSAISDAVSGEIAAGEDLLYVQGMDGPNVSIQFPYINDLKDQVAVNQAELIFTIEDQSDPLIYPPAQQVVLSYINEDETEVIVDDFIFSSLRGSLGLFGGQPEEFTTTAGTVRRRYRMNISAHLQKMINETVPNTLTLKVIRPPEEPSRAVLSLLRKPEVTGRTVLLGSGDGEFPVTLRVNYTNLN